MILPLEGLPSMKALSLSLSSAMAFFGILSKTDRSKDLLKK